jgi:uncharacterized protein YjeT (DUF2065 family)
MQQLILIALGLVFIFEGILPFLAPDLWRRMIQNMMIQQNKALRVFGLISMLTGLFVLYLTR